MPAKLLLDEGYDFTGHPPEQTIELTANQGLLRYRRPCQEVHYSEISPAELGVGAGLARHIEHWVRRYAAFRDGLPYSYSPQDCIEFPLEAFNAEGEWLAGEVARALDDSWLALHRALKRTRSFYLSYLCDIGSNHYLRERIWGDGTPMLDRKRCHSNEDFPGKWLRFAFDYSSDCIWDVTGAGACIQDLPIPPADAQALELEVADLLRRWEIWDEADTEKQEASETHRIERKFLAEAGLRLACKIKHALPDDWTVVYLDIERAARRADRSAFEYRV